MDGLLCVNLKGQSQSRSVHGRCSRFTLEEDPALWRISGRAIGFHPTFWLRIAGHTFSRWILSSINGKKACYGANVSESAG